MSLRRVLAPVAAAAILVLPGCASGQSIGWYDPGRYRHPDAVSYGEVRRVAHERGYREGLKDGSRDARRGERFRYEDEREFRQADRGYHRRYGDRERYRQFFRDGYAAGYGDGYSRIAGHGRHTGRPGYGRYEPPAGGSAGRYGGGYYSPAIDNGIRDGYEKGREDARKNRGFDPLRHSWYRAGDRHYESRYGPRQEYKDLYRRGFQQGYEQGYREARYR